MHVFENSCPCFSIFINCIIIIILLQLYILSILMLFYNFIVYTVVQTQSQ